MKKYILIIAEHQEKDSLFWHSIEMLKEEFRVVYANCTSEAIGFLKMIKPVLTLINNDILKANRLIISHVEQIIYVRYNRPVLLYNSHAELVTYTLSINDNKFIICNPQNITETVEELKNFIANFSVKNTRAASKIVKHNFLPNFVAI